MIFNLSNGLTTVREAAPAHPPAVGAGQSHFSREGKKRRTNKVGYYFLGNIGRK